MTIITTDTTNPQLNEGDRQRRRFACDEGVATLYKFTPFDTPERRKWVAEILQPPHRIYLAAPSQLNDEFDLRPLVRLPTGISERELRDSLTTDAEQHWARKPPTSEELARYRARLRVIDLNQLAREAEDRVHHRLESHYGVFSLACQRGLIQMWDEYADFRRGLCIHFRADALSPFGYAQRVIYQAERPILYLPLPGERDVADITLLTKTQTRWEKEREYRLLRYPEAVYEEIGLRVDGRYGYFRADTITGITVGTDMPEADVEVIKDCARQFDPPLPIDRPRLVAVLTDRPTDGRANVE
jgi:hypothetical protein